MDLIDQKLTTASLDPKYKAALRASVGIAKKTANCYYNKTDESELLCVAMILHPRHKLEYFKNNDWPKEWIEMAKKIV
ncbi:hypothetical protein C0991_005417 [Blastosporella zonata]|nr:hypothetical protein C0991_005417 [Blastosporella zonata]